MGGYDDTLSKSIWLLAGIARASRNIRPRAPASRSKTETDRNPQRGSRRFRSASKARLDVRYQSTLDQPRAVQTAGAGPRIAPRREQAERVGQGGWDHVDQGSLRHDPSASRFRASSASGALSDAGAVTRCAIDARSAGSGSPRLPIQMRKRRARPEMSRSRCKTSRTSPVAL